MSAENQGAPKRLPTNPSLENLKKQAKQLARNRPSLSLQQAQHQLAKSYGCANWKALLLQVCALQESADVSPGSPITSPEIAGRLRHEGPRHWIDGIEPLDWFKSGQCTVIASLSRAMSMAGTEEAVPCDYVTLMGDSAMAFRLRWHRRGGFRQTSAKPATWWAFTMAYAGGPEDEGLLQNSTGWRFDGTPYHYPNDARSLEQLPRLREFVDRGIPVVGCFPEEFGVLHGYDGETDEVLVTAYQKPGAAFWMPLEEVGTKLIYLVSRQPAASRSSSVAKALRGGLSNWTRGEVSAPDAGSAWEEPHVKIQYGAAAYREWIDDLLHADLVAERSRQQLRTASAFNLTCLADARRAAAAYLRQSQSALPSQCSDGLTAAAEIYEALSTEISELRTPHEEFFGVWYGEDLSDWTSRRRENEVGLLERFAEMDAAAVRELQVITPELPAPEL